MRDTRTVPTNPRGRHHSFTVAVRIETATGFSSSRYYRSSPCKPCFCAPQARTQFKYHDFHSYKKGIAINAKNTKNAQKAGAPIFFNTTAQGHSSATSTSKTMNTSATV